MLPIRCGHRPREAKPPLPAAIGRCPTHKSMGISTPEGLRWPVIPPRHIPRRCCAIPPCLAHTACPTRGVRTLPTGGHGPRSARPTVTCGPLEVHPDPTRLHVVRRLEFPAPTDAPCASLARAWRCLHLNPHPVSPTIQLTHHALQGLILGTEALAPSPPQGASSRSHPCQPGI